MANRHAFLIGLAAIAALAAPARGGAFLNMVTDPSGLGQNLVAYWRLGETALPTAYDETANDHDGTYTGFAVANLGQQGVLSDDADTAALFDGVDNHIDLGQQGLVEGRTALTFAMWVRVFDLDNDGCLLAKGEFAGNQPLLVWRDEQAYNSGRTDTFSIMVSGGGNEVRYEAATALSDDTDWHFFAFTFEGGAADGLRFYFDGVEDVTGPRSTASVPSIGANTRPLLIAKPSVTSNKELDGMLDEVVLFDRVLTSQEVLDLYNAVPEPATLTLLGLGLALTLGRRRAP
jgi:hypothetical protein